MLFPFTLQFHWYGLVIGVAIVITVTLIEKIVSRWLSEQEFTYLTFITLVMGIIGARGYHILTDWSLYQDQPLQTWLAVWNGGLGIYGAIMGGGVGIVIGSLFLKKQSHLMHFVDAVSITLPIGQVIGRIGNYLNRELYGLPTSLPWGIVIPPEYRLAQYQSSERFHPLFLYEMLAMSIAFFFLWTTYQQKKRPLGSGWYVGCYLIWYSLTRWLLEWLRIDSARVPGLAGMLSIAQWVAVGLFLLGVVLVVRNSRSQEQHVQT